ncbi:MAG: efflux RND transporter periplasmic adaptor subunit [Proteobacteria bacterium]|nr:efflux RND transporter periplasmic adaptor subunit [Pseudomonadota bacterium]
MKQLIKKQTGLRIMNNTKLIGSIFTGLILVTLIACEQHDGDHTHGPNMMASHDDHNDHKHEEQSEKAKGPHGGWLFAKGNFELEVKIFEKGVPPEFRVYAYIDHQPVKPEEMEVSITLKRLAKAPEKILFSPERDYLLGNGKIYEPHSFDVIINANYQGQSYSWTTQQLEGRVEMDGKTLRRTGAEISTAGPITLQESTDLPGEIRFNPDQLAHVVSPLSGVITANYKRHGQTVEKEEVLAVIKSRELATLKGNYLANQERYALANKLFNREKQLRKEGISAEQDYLNSETRLAEAKIDLKQSRYVLIALGIDVDALKYESDFSRYEIRSPLSGVVINKHLSLGESVTPENKLFVLADLSNVWVEFIVYPRHLNSVHVGQSVSVEIEALEHTLPGTVAWIGPLVGDETRSAKAYIILENPERTLRPGLFVNVQIEDARAVIPVAVKRSAIQTYNDWQVVFVKDGDQFEVRPVELGKQDDKWVEIIQGLDAGTEYVSANSYLFKAELGKSAATHDH